jgi:galactose mutarotase-like enzyme
MGIAKRSLDGVEVIAISGGIEATFAPSAGMVACSLRHRGEELLGQRGGLRTYIREHSTMGIPLLYPWANRLSSARFEVAGREVVLDADPLPRHLSRDPDGLPIHGLLSADEGWRVERIDSHDDGGGGVLVASLDFGERPDLLAAFPFPHLLRVEASVSGSKLTVTATVVANGGVAVPISFGFHPYFQLPGVDRSAWEIEVPVRRQLVLDELGLPTGERVAADVEAGPLGERTFDDAFEAPPDGAPFVLRGDGHTIAVSFESGYEYAQVFAPADDGVIAYEPMTAPTNALVHGGDELSLLDPGDEYEAVFSITVD